jgi:predicted Zn finger-like uncharacterized protein
MRLITQCPACSTVFRVVPDQLRISEGWVRCGHCDEVFDGNAHLQTLSDVDDAGVYEAQTDTNLADGSNLTQPGRIEPSGPLPSFDVATADHTPLSFMRQDEGLHPRQAVRGKKWMVLLCFALALLLATQILVRERGHIAAAAPALRPLLLAVCERLACTVSAPQQMEAIAIERSAFTRLEEEVYLLNFSLKNSASSERAIPALELTLTDNRDQPLLRRVLQAAEFTDRQSIAASVELNASVPMHIQKSADSMPITGYRLLAFYP